MYKSIVLASLLLLGSTGIMASEAQQLPPPGTMFLVNNLKSCDTKEQTSIIFSALLKGDMDKAQEEWARLSTTPGPTGMACGLVRGRIVMGRVLYDGPLTYPDGITLNTVVAEYMSTMSGANGPIIQWGIFTGVTLKNTPLPDNT